jgi:hypothetical protein
VVEWADFRPPGLGPGFPERAWVEAERLGAERCVLGMAGLSACRAMPAGNDGEDNGDSDDGSDDGSDEETDGGDGSGSGEETDGCGDGDDSNGDGDGDGDDSNGDDSDGDGVELAGSGSALAAISMPICRRSEAAAWPAPAGSSIGRGATGTGRNLACVTARPASV